MPAMSGRGRSFLDSFLKLRAFRDKDLVASPGLLGCSIFPVSTTGFD